MIFRSRIKWAAVLGLVLSVLSLLVHLFLAKYSTAELVQYSAMVGLSDDFTSKFGRQSIRYRKLWGAVKPLESLQPYANPRSKQSVPNEQNNGIIYAKIFGGFEKIRSSITDLVTISRLLNATLVIPEIQESTHSKGISSKFKSFSYLYNEEQFIAALMNDVIIMKSLPKSLKEARKRNELPLFKPKTSASPDFYIREVLPVLKKAKVIGLILTSGGCLQSILPPSMSEYQRLRCRVAFHALHFRPEILALGHRMVERLRGSGQPYLAFHPGLVRDTLAYHGCAELFQDVHTELIQHRRARMIKQGIINEELSIDSHMRRGNGSCPLMPEEVGLLLRAMGYPPNTIIYLAGSETFGGQRVLIPLRTMYANLVDRTSLCSKQELYNLIGPEASLPPDSFQSPPSKSEEQLNKEWKKAGPRPRPLPPPPDRPIYRHEKEGWYGWVAETDTEPEPSPMDLRMQAHRLLWDALDYIVSVEADAFFPGFNNDGSGLPDFSSLVMGHRLYEMASTRTYRPDRCNSMVLQIMEPMRMLGWKCMTSKEIKIWTYFLIRKILAELFNCTRDHVYYPKHNWTLSVREHLNKSLGEAGLVRESRLSKPTSFLYHPLPECSCRTPGSAEIAKSVLDSDGRLLYGGEDECPKWMQHGLATVSLKAAGLQEVSPVDEKELPEDEMDLDEQPESDDNGSKMDSTPPFEQDEEMDPDD